MLSIDYHGTTPFQVAIHEIEDSCRLERDTFFGLRTYRAENGEAARLKALLDQIGPPTVYAIDDLVYDGPTVVIRSDDASRIPLGRSLGCKPEWGEAMASLFDHLQDAQGTRSRTTGR